MSRDARRGDTPKGADDLSKDDISKREVVYRVPGMEGVRVRRDVEYGATDAGALTMDVYYPPGAEDGAAAPAVVFVAGFPDAGFEAKVGRKFKEMGSTVSWARLAAASGLVGVTYTNREPEADLCALLRHVRRSAAHLGIDAGRLGLWAGSGNVPLALSALMREAGGLKCAALCYGYMLDLDGQTVVAEASKAWGFSNPCAGRTPDELPGDVPLFVVRAGRDLMPGLNETIERFAAAALRRNLPLTLVNHAAAPHAFDLLDDSEASREAVRQILAFLRFHLLTAPGA